jgi:hypothetical protein
MLEMKLPVNIVCIKMLEMKLPVNIVCIKMFEMKLPVNIVYMTVDTIAGFLKKTEQISVQLRVYKLQENMDT